MIFRKITKLIASNFIAGVLSLLPLTIAIFLVVQFVSIIEFLYKFIGDSSDPNMLIYFSIMIVALIVLVGSEMKNNRRIKILTMSELWLSKFPIIGKIMSLISEFTDMVQGTGKFEGLGVARVEFAGAKVFGLITNERILESGSIEYTVFVVQGTFPPVGMICFYMEEDVEIQEDLTPADIFQMQITLGVKSERE